MLDKPAFILADAAAMRSRLTPIFWMLAVVLAVGVAQAAPPAAADKKAPPPPAVVEAVIEAAVAAERAFDGGDEQVILRTVWTSQDRLAATRPYRRLQSAVRELRSAVYQAGFGDGADDPAARALNARLADLEGPAPEPLDKRIERIRAGEVELNGATAVLAVKYDGGVRLIDVRGVKGTWKVDHGGDARLPQPTDRELRKDEAARQRVARIEATTHAIQSGRIKSAEDVTRSLGDVLTKPAEPVADDTDGEKPAPAPPPPTRKLKLNPPADPAASRAAREAYEYETAIFPGAERIQSLGLDAEQSAKVKVAVAALVRERADRKREYEEAAKVRFGPDDPGDERARLTAWLVENTDRVTNERVAMFRRYRAAVNEVLTPEQRLTLEALPIREELNRKLEGAPPLTDVRKSEFERIVKDAATTVRDLPEPRDPRAAHKIVADAWTRFEAGDPAGLGQQRKAK